MGAEILHAAQPEVHTGIAPVDEAVREALPAAEPTHSVNRKFRRRKRRRAKA